MAETTTYSFLDLAGAIGSAALGFYSFTGEGTGQITVTMASDKSAHNRAADGSIMVSKIAGNNGTVNIQVQQTSSVHKWLVNAYNALLLGDTSVWASLAGVLKNSSDGTGHVLTGGSFQKLADKSYQEQGQMVSWSLMFADIQTINA